MEKLVIDKFDLINSIRENIEFINKNLNEDISIFKMDNDQLEMLYFYLEIIVNNIKHGKEE